MATLATGLAAVIGATIIGWRQSGILNQQVRFQGTALKAEIFDRKMVIYNEILRSVRHVATQGYPVKKAYRASFSDAVTDSRFLFSENVYKQLSEIESMAGRYWIDYTKYSMIGDRSTAEAIKLKGECDRYVVWFSGRLETLFKLFEPEMRLNITD